MNTTIAGIFVSAVLLICTVVNSANSQVTTHPVPWEFASDRYNVTVNGKPATVFFASMNLLLCKLRLHGAGGRAGHNQ